jgi:DNA polymerase-4
MDEYFIDVNFMRDASRKKIHRYCRNLKRALYEELHLVCSVGVARSKTYAKLASGLQKPDGLTILFDREDEKTLITRWPWMRYGALATAGTENSKNKD